MPRACLICADVNKTKLAAEMIASGKSDELIAKTLGGLTKGSARRHRVNHVEREVRAVLQAANRTRDIRAQRDRIVAAAEAGYVNAASWLSIERIAEAVRRVEMRLERVSQAAEVEGRHLAVAALAGQELKAATVAARLGGVGGYATPRSDRGNAPPFVLTINFSGGRETRIEGTPAFEDLEPGPLSIGRTGDLPTGGTPRGLGDMRNWAREFGSHDTDDLDEEI